MTLQKIREAKTFDDLKPAIKFLCDNMQKMTWGEFIAYRRTLENQAIKVGSTLKDLIEYTEQYQESGHEETTK